MEELAKALHGTIDKYQPEDKSADSELLFAAQRWACYCMKNMTGDLLKRGLAVAEALATFDCGFYHPETLKD